MGYVIFKDGEYNEVDENPVAPAEPLVINTQPQAISDRQFFQQLAIDGEITEQEALDAVSMGALPAPLEAVIATLAGTDQFAARMFLKGATLFERNHPMTLTLATLLGWTPTKIDTLWSAAASL